MSTHPRYRGSGVFGQIGKVFGKLVGKVSKKATGEMAKKLAQKAVKTAGEQAGKAVAKKTQSIVDKKASELLDKVMEVASKTTKKKTKAPTKTQAPKTKVQKTQAPKKETMVQSITPEERINRIMAGSGAASYTSGVLTLADLVNKASRGPQMGPLGPQMGPSTTLQDIINRGINTLFLGSGIKTI